MAKYTYNPPYNQWSGNRSDTLNKWKINYKGSIATASALPSKGEFKGDTYNVLEDGSNYMWNGTSWDKLDANTYVGATSEASGIRGLVPPATTSQMYSLLTGSGVWKSGAELGFAYDNAVVHLAGEETITGNKKFTGDFALFNQSIQKGTNPNTATFTGIPIGDNTNNSSNENRLSVIESIIEPDGKSILRLAPYKFVAGSTNRAMLDIVIESDGTAYMHGPSTLESRTYDYDILTRDWIPKDTRIVHTTGNETIGGAKTFSDITTISKSNSILQLINTGTSGTYCDIRLSSTGGNATTTIRDVYQGNLIIGHTYQGEAWGSGAGLEFSYSSGNFNLSACAGSDGTRRNLGGESDGTLRWNGQTIQTTSDERLKTSLSEVPDAVLDAWKDVNWGQFQYLDAVASKGESARLHLGLIAQHVMSVFEKHGLDACAYGILCHEEREATEDSEAVDLWMVRYAEAQAMEAACQRRRAERAEARIKALEDRLEALEVKLA